MPSFIDADPVKWTKYFWPHIRLYNKQQEILYSVRDNIETMVPAGNMLGKDFISALVCLWFFFTRSPCRIGTTSAQFEQLNDILWGEIRHLLETSKYRFPSRLTHMKIQQLRKDGTVAPKSELVGRVVNKGESFLGRHPGLKDVPRTLLVIDEASGVDNETYDKANTWADRILVIGNPFPCENFFKKGVEAGDKLSKDGTHYYRKVIKITALDSPNVRYAIAEKKAGKEFSNKILVPGVLTYPEYEYRLEQWDKEKRCISLDGEFYKGEEILLFPEEWLAYSYGIWNKNFEPAKAMGVDTAEGGDNTTFCVGGEKKLIEMTSEKTPDTSVVADMTIERIRRFNLDPEDVYFDLGGGGKEHVDYLRRKGYNCQLVFFGTAKKGDVTVTDRQWKSVEERQEKLELQDQYKNKRAELYHIASRLINPSYGGYGLPPISEGKVYEELYRQLKVIPKKMDGEGKYYLPPKRKQPHSNTKEVSLEEMLGCSPDEADSFVLMSWGLRQKEEEILL